MTENLADPAYVFVYIVGGAFYLLCWGCIFNVCLHSCYSFEKTVLGKSKVDATNKDDDSINIAEERYYKNENGPLLDLVAPLKSDTSVSEMLGSLSSRKKSKYSN